MKNPQKTTNINAAYLNIRDVLEKARFSAARAINAEMVYAYWQIGKIIVEEEQKGKKRAGYGEQLIHEVSERLTVEYGRGFNQRNLWYMKQFYLRFRNVNALRSELSWTHYRLLLRIEDKNALAFYLHETIASKWSTRELERQMNSLLFERIALSKDKNRIKQLSRKGQKTEKPIDAIKDPYILEFLGIRENTNFLEKDLEKALLEKLQKFLLELGKGFSFICRQKRITVDNQHYYIDLVFYNYTLKCFFLIDLKVGALTHQDIGQMDFYVRYFEAEEKQKGDNPTVGLILCSDKNEVMAKYTLLADKKQIFASKYKLYLPTEKELRRELRI